MNRRLTGQICTLTPALKVYSKLSQSTKPTKAVDQNTDAAQAELRPKPKSNAHQRSGEAVLAGQVGINTAIVLPKQMQQFTGEKVMTLMDLIDHFHKYILENNLYYNENKESFFCDATLERALGVYGVHPIAKLAQLISPHFTNPFAVDAEYKQHAEQLLAQHPKRDGGINLGQIRERNDLRGRNGRDAHQELSPSRGQMLAFGARDMSSTTQFAGKESAGKTTVAQTKLRSKSKAKVPQTNDGPVVVKKTGLNTAMVLSKRMQEFAGTEMMTRAELCSLFLQYIRENNLYVQGDRQRFKCDATLEVLFGTTGIHNRSHIMRLMSPHLTSPSLMGAEYERRSRQLFEEELKERGAIDRRQLRFVKDSRGRNSPKKQALRKRGIGLFAEVEIAPRLQPLCGGQQRMSRPQALKAVWRYIKTNNLQDPSKRRRIIVNEVLRNALQVSADREWIDCFHVTGYVSNQLTSIKA